MATRKTIEASTDAAIRAVQRELYAEQPAEKRAAKIKATAEARARRLAAMTPEERRAYWAREAVRVARYRRKAAEAAAE